MKLLPSPSCSSSSSFSTSTFDANVCNPRAAATPSCLSGILRRILCSGSLPTHPSDQITEETNSVKSDDRALQDRDLNVMKSTNEAKPSAGIVARLMGLESMPERKQKHNSILRSKSMNSVEHFYKHLQKFNKGSPWQKINKKSRIRVQLRRIKPSIRSRQQPIPQRSRRSNPIIRRRRFEFPHKPQKEIVTGARNFSEPIASKRR